VTAITGFAIAMAVYAVAFVTFFSVAHLPGEQGHADATAMQGRAQSGLEELLGSSGWRATSGGTTHWEASPDATTRLGLAQQGVPGFLDFTKLRNLTRGGVATSTSNGLLDYEEARKALGLGDYQFHFRLFPVSDPTALGGSAPLGNFKAAYVGHFDPIAPGSPPTDYPVLNSSAVEDKGAFVFVNVTVTNNGTTTTQFTLTFAAALSQGTITDQRFTPVLQPGQAEVLAFKLYKHATFLWGGLPRVEVTIQDPHKQEGHFYVDLTGVVMTGGTGVPVASDVLVTATPEKASYLTNQYPMVDFTVWTPTGRTEANPTVNITVRNAATGAQVDQWQGSGNGGKHQLCCKLDAGAYNLTIWSQTSAFNASSVLVITDDLVDDFHSAYTPYAYSESAGSVYERGLIAGLVQGWANTKWTSGGDVYGDLGTDLNTGLAANLTNDKYDVVVVGSMTNQTAMDSASAQTAVKEWVRRGGLLVLLGTGTQDAPWLTPLADVRAVASALPIVAADPSFPSFQVPQPLGWRSYVNDGASWRFDSASDQARFYPVLLRGSDDASDVVFAVSKAGNLGDGGMVLTGWKPYALTSPLHDEEARAAMYDLLWLAYQPLFVEAGPYLQESKEVASASRLATAPNPFLAGQKVLVRATLYVFQD